MSEQQPLMRRINRAQMVMRTVDVEGLIAEDHPARLIWQAVGQLDLTAFYEEIGSNAETGGRPTFPPQLLISMWAYAYSRGIGSAREVDRQSAWEPGLQWLTGLERVNYHTLADFRVQHNEALDQLFTQLLGVLSAQGLVRLEQVMVDGSKIKAQSSGNQFRREKSLREHLEEARKQVEALSDPADEGLSQRQKSARERGLREKQELLEEAVKQLEQLQAEKKDEKEKEEVRVSMTDPEARRMKQADGGWAPSYNAQICTDGAHGVIVDADVTQAGNDYQQLLPAVERVEERMGRKMGQAVGDGGYTSHANVEKMAERGTDFLGKLSEDERKARREEERFAVNLFVYEAEKNQFVCPAGKVLKYEGKQGKDGQISYKYKARRQDCAECALRLQCCGKNQKHGRSVVRREETVAMMAFRAKMATAEAQEQYRRRAPIAEFPNAWIKQKFGLRQFHMRGLLKVKAELLWACFTFNLKFWIRWQKRPCALAGVALA